MNNLLYFISAMIVGALLGIATVPLHAGSWAPFQHQSDRPDQYGVVCYRYESSVSCVKVR